ncbi:MAG: immunoglobulin domain-containing protein, partial [Verrucomicrobia subdivision 3 bacterium]|nr:immunoglobulin domain-containing protein [Limisphaerales bacterium]
MKMLSNPRIRSDCRLANRKSQIANRKSIVSVLCGLLLAVTSQAANIAWVSFHPDDNTPSAAAATAGFTQAPDIAYTQLLRANGHTVTRVVSSDIPNAAVLNAADLVIISRSVPSGHYELDAETAAWNGLTAPVIIMGGYVLRNNRLGFTTGTGIPDTDGPIKLTALVPSHPIFAGISLDGGNTMVNNYALSGTNGSVTFTNLPQRGISVNTNPVAGGGMVLATVAAGDPNVAGGMIVAEWQAGATMGNSPPDTLGGRRLVFLSGTRELAITAEGAGIYDLTPDGAQLFLNAVNYMAPAPAGYRETVLADGPIAYYRFSDSGTVATNEGSRGAAADGTYINGATTGAEAPRPPQFVGFEADNTAAQLDGVDDFVRSASGLLNGLTNVTMSAWIRRAGAQRNRTGLLGQDNVIEFGYIDNNTLQTWVDDFATPVNVITPFPDLEWDYVAVVVDGDALQMTTYTNGQAAGTAPLPSTNYNFQNNTNFFVIGGDAFGNGVSFNGQIDEVAVFDKALTADQIAAHYFSTVAQPPTIVRQPQATNIFVGQTLALSVEAIGSPPLRYQWLFFNNVLPGQTSATLVISNAQSSAGGSYSVRVSNQYGTNESATVDVNVQETQPPTITQHPQSTTRYAGTTATFTVAATGGANLSYQWQFNGTNLPGQTSPALTLSSVSSANAGPYLAVVGNTVGSVTSVVATLTVIAVPPGGYAAAVIASQPFAYWRLGETSGPTAFDYVGGNHGSYSNVVLGLPGAIAGDPDTAAGFNGTNSWVGTPVSLNGLSNLTMIGWIRRNGPQDNRTGLFGQNDLVEFGYINNDTIQAWVDNFNTAVNVSPNPIPDQQWGFVALTLNNGTLTVQVNDGADGMTNLPSANPGTSTFRFNIGGGIFDTFTANGNWFDGRIDEVALYNRALSTSELNALYALGVPSGPVITCSTNIVAECTGGLTPVSYTVTAVDSGGAPVPVVCVPASGSGFRVGQSNVVCTATDTSGLSASCTFQVAVTDTTPPQVTCP